MSDPSPPLSLSPSEGPAYRAARERVLRLHFATTFLLLVGIGMLVVYVIMLGPLVGPGVEQSFGLALSLLFLMSALLVHLVDRTYRVWPAGRRVHPLPPPLVTDRRIVHGLRIVVVLAAGAIIAYVIAGLVSG